MMGGREESMVRKGRIRTRIERKARRRWKRRGRRVIKSTP
jgi:hypothetical protein